VTFDPEIDIQSSRPYNPTIPCLVTLDFKVQETYLNLFALFRSHDFGRKVYGNYIGLGRLTKYICTKTALKEVTVVCYSRSAHIRAKELAYVKTILEGLEKSNLEKDEIITL
jgi:thymidylate synthase